MERMVEVVPDSNGQSLQHFATHSPWGQEPLVEQIAVDTNAQIGGDPDSCLIVDESANSKKGDKSVGVARQWDGRQGKVDNCQVAVYTALCRRDRASLVDTRLFLPKVWTDDEERCRKAGVPEDRLEHRSKTQLATEMVQAARQRGLEYAWVGADGGYGKEPQFLRTLDAMNEIFMVDVHSNQTVYLEDPAPYVPERKSKRGRAPTRLRTDQPSITVSDWLTQQPADAWTEVVLRDSSKGELITKVICGRVWLWDGKEEQAHQWHLVVSIKSESVQKIEYRYSLSNAPADTPAQRLAFMQSQRYWIEATLKNAKSNAGMADYQVRGWTGWHHHMAMVMLAMLFMLETRIKHEDSHELLSCADIEALLSHFLPRRDITKEEVLRQMEVRHKQRAAATEHHRRRKKRKS